MVKYFLYKDIEKGLKGNKRKRTFLNFENIKKVLIFFDAEQWQEVKPIVKDLKSKSKEVYAWTILPKEQTEETSNIKYPDWVTVLDLNKDLNWMKVFRSDIFDNLNKLEYDTLLDLTLIKDDYFLSLLVQNKSSFCIGITENIQKQYDYILFHEPDKRLIDTYNELKKYLSHNSL